MLADKLVAVSSFSVGGVRTNRVKKVSPPRRRKPVTPKKLRICVCGKQLAGRQKRCSDACKAPRVIPSSRKALALYRKDPSRGTATTTICISLPIAELVDLDALAARVQLPRSRLIRQAVKHFAAWCLGPQGGDGG